MDTSMDTFSVVGAIYPRIGNMTLEADERSEDSNEITFKPNRILVSADVHSELPSRRSPRSPGSSSLLSKSSPQLSNRDRQSLSPRKSPRALSSWGSVSRGSDEIESLEIESHQEASVLNSSKGQSSPEKPRPNPGRTRKSRVSLEKEDQRNKENRKRGRPPKNGGTTDKSISESNSATVKASENRQISAQHTASQSNLNISLSRSRSGSSFASGSHNSSFSSDEVVKSNKKSGKPAATPVKTLNVKSKNSTVTPVKSLSKNDSPGKSSTVVTPAVSPSESQCSTASEETTKSKVAAMKRNREDVVNKTSDVNKDGLRKAPQNKDETSAKLPKLSISLNDCMNSSLGNFVIVGNGSVKSVRCSPKAKVSGSEKNPKNGSDTESSNSRKQRAKKNLHTRSGNGSPPVAKRQKHISTNEEVITESSRDELSPRKCKSSPQKPKSSQQSPQGPKVQSKLLLRTKQNGSMRVSTPEAGSPPPLNDSFDLTPDSSSTPSVSGDNLARSPPIRKLVQHFSRSDLSNFSSGSDADCPNKSDSSGRQKYYRRTARKARRMLRRSFESPKKKQPDDVQSENSEISSLLKSLPAWQSWLQQKAGGVAQPLRAICFLESSLPSNQVLHRVLLRSFGIDEQDIFTWQPPDALQLSQQHMLRIMKDIAANLRSGEINEVQRVMLKLDESDIFKYTKQIEFDENYVYKDQETRLEIQSKMWTAVRDCLQEGCANTGIIGCIVNVSDINVLVLLLNKTLDPQGDIYKSMLNSQSHKISLFSFRENNLDWQVNLRPRHTQEMYMEEEQTTVCRWLLSRVDSCCEVAVHPVDEMLRQNQLSVNAYLQEHLPKRLPSGGNTKPTTMVLLIGPVNLDIVNVSEYCRRLIPNLLERHSDVPCLFLVVDFGELEGCVVRTAVIPDQLPEDVSHRVWMAGDPKVLPVSCLILQLTRKNRLSLAPCFKGSA